MKAWNYRLPCSFYAMGTVYAKNERELRAKIRLTWGYSRLPKGTEVWLA